MKSTIIWCMLLLASGSANAQKLLSTVTERQKKQIDESVKQTLTSYQKLLGLIMTADRSEVNDLIEGAFRGGDVVFANEGSWIKYPGKQPLKIRVFLQELRENFTTSRDNDPVRLTSIILGDLAKADAQNYLQVEFDEQFIGVDALGKKYARQPLVATMIVERIDNRWVTRISSIEPAVDKTIPDISRKVKVVPDDPDATPVAAARNEALYGAKLQQAAVADGQNDFLQAYIALRTARDNGPRAVPDSRLEALRQHMRQARIDDYNGWLYSHLYEKAKAYEGKFMLREAKYCYYLANDHQETKVENKLLQKIDDLNEKIAELDRLEQLYLNKNYEDAIRQYRELLRQRSNAGNTNLYLGLARCFTKTAPDSATRYFKQAIRINPDYAPIYKFQGDFFKEQNDYERAYQSYTQYIAHAEDPFDPALKEGYAELSLCKGVSLYNEGLYTPAFDSFSAALTLNPANVEAYLYQARYYSEIRKEHEKALDLIAALMKIDKTYAPAYFVKGETYVRMETNTRKYYQQAEENLREALRLRENDIEYCRTLAVFCRRRIGSTSGKEKARYLEDAVKYFMYCRDRYKGDTPDTYTDQGQYYNLTWDIGNAYYLAKNYAEAWPFYKKIEKHFRGNNNIFDREYGEVEKNK